MPIVTVSILQFVFINYSSVISATTGNVPPEAPSLEMTNSSYQSIKLHWKFIGAQSKANELKYDLQKRSGDEGR